MDPVLTAADHLEVDERGRGALVAATRYKLLEAASVDEAIALLVTMHKECPSAPIMVVSRRSGRFRAAVAYSAAGFAPKIFHQSAIEAAVKAILAKELVEPDRTDTGDYPDQQEAAEIWCRIQSLTSQQKVVLGLLIRGKLNKQIAFELNVS